MPLTQIPENPPPVERPVIFPQTFGQQPRCEVCFTARPADWQRGRPFLATMLNPDPDGPPLLDGCPGCYRALHGTGEIVLPTAAELPQVWMDLARDAFNRDLAEATITRALTTLAPGLPTAAARAVFTALQTALYAAQQNGDAYARRVKETLAVLLAAAPEGTR
ncbi:hypothetical protein [Thermomonospora cellulosilytica]|uniref:Uncharacterized protein n=1 Tax=Thermomonospora cellulosilytica TaxID=1411118 RepID=A0A7W3RAS8_9ACTN|nr:hypothetical protein [Thermomonospora cellulosilytica]MBA9006014.1 hypothetical protein [Thermomonospora cellulosilytica]